MSEGALAYSEALSGALWDTALAQPDWLWRYRGLDLRRAAVCEAYFTLRDDPTLQAAFRGEGPLPEQRTPFTEAAAKRLVRGVQRPEPPSRVERLLLGSRRGLRALGANLKHFGARLGAGSSGEASSLDLLIQVRHEKCLRTLAPVLEVLTARGVSFGFGLAAMSVDERGSLRYAIRERGWIAHEGQEERSLPGTTGPALWFEPRLTRELDRHLAELESLRPRALLLVEGNGRHDSLAAVAGRAAGVPVLCLQHGWPPRLHAGFRRFELDAFLAWGAGFGQLLLPMNPGLRTIPVGNALMPPAPERAPSEGRATTFFLQSVRHGITAAAFEGFIRLIEESAPSLESVVVRSHPSYPPDAPTRARLDAIPNLRWRDVPEPLEAVLADSRLTVAIHSTTIHESVAAGVLPLVVNLDGLPPLQPDVVAAGAGLLARTLDEGRSALERAGQDAAWLDGFAPAMARFRERYFAAGGAEAAQLAAEAILRAMGSA